MPSLLDDPPLQDRGGGSSLLGIPGATPLQITQPDANQPDTGTGLADLWQRTSDWIQQQRQQSVAEGLLDPSTGLPTAKGLVDAARQTAQGIMLGTTAPGEAPPVPGITAYHGSPHDFSAFDASKIGTGEGAQAYGHGLYFAGNEGVARSYRDALAGPPTVSGVQVDGVPAEDAGLSPSAVALAKMHLDGFQTLDNLRASNEASLQKAQDVLQRSPNNTVGIANRDMANRSLDALDELKGRDLTYQEPQQPGHMYQVNIGADPESFLHWDKPLSEQSQSVKDALAKVPWAEPYLKSGNLPGSQIVPQTPEGAQQLLDAGIPGIKYLDQGSRGAGEGTHNYVVFNANTIDILRKYGLAGLGLGLGAAGTQGRQQ